MVKTIAVTTSHTLHMPHCAACDPTTGECDVAPHARWGVWGEWCGVTSIAAAPIGDHPSGHPSPTRKGIPPELCPGVALSRTPEQSPDRLLSELTEEQRGEHPRGVPEEPKQSAAQVNEPATPAGRTDCERVVLLHTPHEAGGALFTQVGGIGARNCAKARARTSKSRRAFRSAWASNPSSRAKRLGNVRGWERVRSPLAIAGAARADCARVPARPSPGELQRDRGEIR